MFNIRKAANMTANIAQKLGKEIKATFDFSRAPINGEEIDLVKYNVDGTPALTKTGKPVYFIPLKNENGANMSIQLYSEGFVCEILYSIMEVLNVESLDKATKTFKLQSLKTSEDAEYSNWYIVDSTPYKALIERLNKEAAQEDTAKSKE